MEHILAKVPLDSRQPIDRKRVAGFAGGDATRCPRRSRIPGPSLSKFRNPPMSSGKPNQPRHSGNVSVAVIVIGSLTVLLVVGLTLPGILDRLDGLVARLTLDDAGQAFPKSLPSWSIWLSTIFLSYAVPFAILEAPGRWRRLMLWFTALVLVAGWAPVLVLAARAPDISAPWIATLWSGICAIFYAANHRMPADADSATPPASSR